MFCIFRLVVLSLRAQSLLNLKLYKMKRHELKDYQKTIQDVLAKSEEDPSTSSEGQSRTEQMSTPSPAGSEGSNCSKVRQQIFLDPTGSLAFTLLVGKLVGHHIVKL